MFQNPNINKTKEDILYYNILLLSRNKLFYTKFNLQDTFHNRINLIFLHVSFLFAKTKRIKKNKFHKIFNQKMFDLIFLRIEQNMREIGYGDVVVNKNMKFLVKNFYNILLYCENFDKKTQDSKNEFLLKYLKNRNLKTSKINDGLSDYFTKYCSFCFDLSPDSVLSGKLNFKY